MSSPFEITHVDLQLPNLYNMSLIPILLRTSEQPSECCIYLPVTMPYSNGYILRRNKTCKFSNTRTACLLVYRQSGPDKAQWNIYSNLLGKALLAAYYCLGYETLLALEMVIY